MRELFREFVIGKTRAKDQHDERIAHAWLTEMLHRQKEVPKLQQLLSSKAATAVQTVDQQRTMLHALSQTYKIPLRSRRG